MIGSTGADCHLQFYYHMGGTNVGSLQVLRLVGDGNSTLFTLSGVQGDEWKQGNVYIGAGQGYQILIQATRGSNYQGDECIDDVKFIDCAPPVLTGEPCQPSEFRCANTYCIDSNKVCNFVDECMDHSDEDQCDVQVGRCDFELDSCSWQQETGDEFDWSLFSGTTASIGTGPDTDHTIRSNKGHYVFIETSYPQKPADRARLASPTIKGTSSSSNCRITFWYHMYGIDIGSLAVLIRTSYEDDSNLEVVRNITGEQGNFWWQFSEVIDSGGKDFKIVLEGMVGSSYRGDIAIDDIIFSKECIAGGKLPGEDDASKPPHESCDDNPSQFKCDTGDKCFDSWERCNFKSECSDASDEKDCGKSCDFESGQCGWTNSVGDSFNWTRGHGPSWTTYTGPNTDHTYNTTKGHFMVLPTNTSYTYTGYKAHLQTLPFQRSGENCEMTFWYHMYGLYIGSLNVYIKYANHQSTKIWSMVGEQGNSWMEATIDIGQQEEFSILLEGVRGSSIYGDIGIDDIQFSNCGDSTFARPCEDGTEFKCVNDGSCIPLERYCDYRQDCGDMSDEKQCVVKPGDCHFDDSNLLCDWIQYEDDDIDWVVAKTTPNDNTGPNHDHTTVNTTGNSQFLYVDSVKGSLSDIARISTPKSAIFPASKGVCVLRFWYHMYAVNENGVGGLRVYTESDVTTEQRALYWHVYGNQGNQWNYAKVTIGNPHPFKVVFEAIMGDSMSSDIAIDDVTFTASCYNPGNSTYPVPGSCPRNQFYCVGDSICIPNSWVNDGNIDCPTNCYDEDKYRFKCDSLQPQIGDKGTNVGVIAGGVVGGLIVAALIITLFIVFIKCRNKKGGASFQFNFGFGSKDDDKVRMSDLPDLDMPPQTGEEAYSIDNPVYSGKGSFDLPKSHDIEA
ncbi:MAM and LDL-receptor class A domain-containing protein 1-like [Glandiceps talaboti]